MLVLTRKKQESLVIGTDVEVVVLDVRGEVVKLGIKAPASIPVYRKEIFEQIRNENLASARSEISLEEISHLLNKRSESDEPGPV